MKKWVFIGAGAIVVLIVIVLVVGAGNLGPMIQKAVNTYGPEITQTEVSLGDVDVSLLSAEAKLRDVFLGNPKGFTTPGAMRIGSILVNVDEKSISGDTIVIDRIEVVAPDITYEKIRNTDNFNAILNNVKKAVGADNATGKSSEKGKTNAGKKLLIKDFIVRDGKVNLFMSMLGGKSLSADLPDIHLTDIGGKRGGATPAQAVKEIFAALHAQITSPAVTDVLNDGLKGLTAGTRAAAEKARKQLKAVGEDAKGGVKAATDKLKGLFNK